MSPSFVRKASMTTSMKMHLVRITLSLHPLRRQSIPSRQYISDHKKTPLNSRWKLARVVKSELTLMRARKLNWNLISFQQLLASVFFPATEAMLLLAHSYFRGFSFNILQSRFLESIKYWEKTLSERKLESAPWGNDSYCLRTHHSPIFLLEEATTTTNNKPCLSSCKGHMN